MTAATRPLFSAGPTVVLLAGNSVAAACIVGNWLATRGTSDLSAELSAVEPAIVGVIVAVVANSVWLVAARDALERRRAGLSTRVAVWGAHLDAAATPAPPGAGDVPAQPDPSGMIAVEGATLYHRPDCPLVVHKRVRAADVAVQESRGLRPCGVCEPQELSRPDGGFR